MIAENQTFVGLRVFLDGCSFKRCIFERCTIVFSGLMGAELEGNSFSECQWEFTGPAQNTLMMMSALYSGGGQQLIEATLDKIRNGYANRRPGDPIVLN
jgi:hypothetical protein